jgi:hypothetical protein
MARMKLNKALILVILLFVNLTAGISFANSGNPDLPRIKIESLMDGSFGSRIKKKFYQTIFREAGDMGGTLVDTGDFKIGVRLGRLLLDYESINKITLADHFSLNISAGTTVGGILHIGGNAGLSLIRFRDFEEEDTNAPGDHLADDLKDWDPNREISADDKEAYLTNIDAIFLQTEKELKAGKTGTAKYFFDEDIPEKKYLDLFAGLRLPKEMPWTAKRVLNEKQFRIKDIASFNAHGGIFANIGAGWYGAPAPYFGVFLRGHYQVSVLKHDTDKVLLRVETMRDYGTQWGLFNEKFRIPVLEGFLFGKDLNINIRPIHLAGQSYRSKIFARIYNVHIKNKSAERAYNAAIYGNLTLLDKLSTEENSGVQTLSDRYDEGKHKNQNIKLSFIVYKFNDERKQQINEINFNDERGSFTKWGGTSLRNEYTDKGLFQWAKRRIRTSNMTLEAFTKSPEGVFDPRLSWDIEEINQKAKPEERIRLQNWLTSFYPAPLVKDDKFKKRIESEQLRARVRIQVNAAGYYQLQTLDENVYWQNAANALFGDASVWANEDAREKWLSKNRFKLIVSTVLPRKTAGTLVHTYVDRLAKFMRSKPSIDDFKNWYNYHLGMANSTDWSALIPKILVDSISYENRYLELELESDVAGQMWTYKDGTPDSAVYPDDWEYFNLPTLD